MTPHCGLILVERLEAEPGNHARQGAGTHTACCDEVGHRAGIRSDRLSEGIPSATFVHRLSAPRLEYLDPPGGPHVQPSASWMAYRRDGAVFIGQFGCGRAGYSGDLAIDKQEADVHTRQQSSIEVSESDARFATSLQVVTVGLTVR